ncbi:PepSY domain-containing protein [Pseudomonas sp. 18173]|uniref:PepSY domain-containing protein n=1 Tax=Pseudomonas sp. 18173 TaxID=3390055 RepID=UPI003D200F48
MKVFLLNRCAGSRMALLLLAFCSAVMARDLDQDEALRLRQQGVILPLEQLLQQAMDRYPGAKLLEAELEEKHNIYLYDVELLTLEGVVRELHIDATDGRLLKDKED